MSDVARADSRLDATREQSRPYDAVAQTFHWLVAALIVAQFATEVIPKDWAPKGTLASWHVSIGPSILALMLLRLIWRLTHRPASAGGPLARPTPALAGDALVVLRPADHASAARLVGGIRLRRDARTVRFHPSPGAHREGQTDGRSDRRRARPDGLGAACGDRPARGRGAISRGVQARWRARPHAAGRRLGWLSRSIRPFAISGPAQPGRATGAAAF